MTDSILYYMFSITTFYTNYQKIYEQIHHYKKVSGHRLIRNKDYKDIWIKRYIFHFSTLFWTEWYFHPYNIQKNKIKSYSILQHVARTRWNLHSKAACASATSSSLYMWKTCNFCTREIEFVTKRTKTVQRTVGKNGFFIWRKAEFPPEFFLSSPVPKLPRTPQ